MKNKRCKRTYHLRNWSDYNKALVNRGSLTIWFADETVKAWINHEQTGKRGASQIYTDAAILCMLTLMAVYSLRLRSTQGLLHSLFRLAEIHLMVPDYTTLCRRRKVLEVMLPRQAKGRAIHLVVDSTGLKVYGEGEWKVRQHGVTKRRTWRKLHLGVDEASREIVAAVATTNNVSDDEVLADLLKQVAEDVEQVTADGAYDKRKCYEAIAEKQAQAVIPPRRGARLWYQDYSTGEQSARNENIRRISEVGRAQWKRESGYHQQSLAETTMYRLKTIFGGRLTVRGFEAQASEMLIRCRVLNWMTQLGMPDSYAA